MELTSLFFQIPFQQRSLDAFLLLQLSVVPRLGTRAANRRVEFRPESETSRVVLSQRCLGQDMSFSFKIFKSPAFQAFHCGMGPHSQPRDSKTGHREPDSYHYSTWTSIYHPHQKPDVMGVLLLLLSRFSHVRLCATPKTAAHQAPPSLGFSRQEHWRGLPFPSPMHESEK